MLNLNKSLWVVMFVLTSTSTSAWADDSVSLPNFTGKADSSLNPAFKDLHPAIEDVKKTIKLPSFVKSYTATVDPALNQIDLNMNVRELFIHGNVDSKITVNFLSSAPCKNGLIHCQEFVYDADFKNTGPGYLTRFMPASGQKLTIQASVSGSSLVMTASSTLDGDSHFGPLAGQIKQSMMKSFRDGVRQKKLGFASNQNYSGLDNPRISMLSVRSAIEAANVSSGSTALTSMSAGL